MALWGNRIFSKFFVNGTDSRPERFSARIGAEVAIALIGIALLLWNSKGGGTMEGIVCQENNSTFPGN